MSLAPSGRIKFLVTGARGATFADVARNAGSFGAMSNDSDDDVNQKFADYAIQKNPGFKGDTGNTGPANNTYTSYTDMQASDPTREYAYLANDTDIPPHPDSIYANPTKTVGGWVPKGAAADTPAELITLPDNYPVGATIRTATDQLYKVLPANSPTPDLTTAGGTKLKIIGSVTPEALGAPCDGIGDDAPFFERGWQIAQTLVLNSAGAYRLASIIGIRDQTIFADNAITLQGNGARVILKSPLVNGIPEAIFTSAAAKAAPNSQDDLYTGKLFFAGCNFEQETPSVIFNGDRLYQLEITGNSFSNVDTIIKSFRAKGNGPYPQGYLQSVRIGDNQLSGVRRMIDAKQGFDIAITDNKCSSCLGGAYIDSLTADAAVTRFTWSNNLWQGGGIAIAIGKVIGCTITAGYNESNTGGDAATAKCDIWFKAGPSPSSGVTITGLKFQPNPSQIADPDYVPIRIDYQPLEPVAPRPVLLGCWTAGNRLASPGKAELINCGSNSLMVTRNALAPRLPTAARRTTIGGTQIFLASSELSGSKFRIGRPDVGYVKSLLLDQQRPAVGNIRMLLQHGTAAGVIVGASVVDIGFVMMAASEGVGPQFAVNDVYASFYLKGLHEIAAGQPVDNLGAVTRVHFTNPTLTFVRTGDFYDLFLDGYTPQTNPNYGFSDRIISHLTIEADARNSSLAISSPIEVA